MRSAILGLIVLSFAISWILTFALKRVAPRLGFVDKPGGRKIHANAKPLGGGVAIICSFAIPLMAALVWAWSPGQFKGLETTSVQQALVGGIRLKTAQACVLLLAMLAMHVMGLIDDRRPLGPYSKLLGQLAIVTAVVLVDAFGVISVRVD